MLDKGDNFGINGNFGAREENFSIDYSKAKTKFCITIVIIVTCLLTENKFMSLKQIIETLTFQISFVLKAHLKSLRQKKYL